MSESPQFPDDPLVIAMAGIAVVVVVAGAVAGGAVSVPNVGASDNTDTPSGGDETPTEAPGTDTPSNDTVDTPTEGPVTDTPTDSPVTDTPTDTPTEGPITDTPTEGPVTDTPTASPGENGSPEAWFVFGRLPVRAGIEAELDAAQSEDPDGEIASYEWTIDNSVTATGEVVDHTFDEPGRYWVNLTVTDDDGATDTHTDRAVVVEPNQPPAAAMCYPASGVRTGDEVTFSGSRSSDSDGTIETYEWDFGERELSSGVVVDEGNATGEIVSHTFEEPGRYNVTLTVMDDELKLNETYQTVRVVAPDTRSCQGEAAG